MIFAGCHLGMMIKNHNFNVHIINLPFEDSPDIWRRVLRTPSLSKRECPKLGEYRVITWASFYLDFATIGGVYH